jgi:hypothetical protein
MNLGAGSSYTVRVLNGENVYLSNFAIDGNKAGIVGGDINNCEGFSCKFGSNVHVNDVLAYNCKSEAFDLDESENCSVTNITAIDCGGMAVHLSENTINCKSVNSTAIRCGIESERPAFDTWGSSQGCSIINCTAVECYRGFNCSGNYSQVSNFKAVNCKGWGFYVSGASSNISGVTVNGACIDTSVATKRAGVITGNDHNISGVVISGLTSGQVLEVQASYSNISLLQLDGTTSNTVQMTAGAQHTRIENIVINGGANGIASSAPNTTVSNATISGVTGDGILASGQYFHGTGITVNSPGSDGIQIDGSDATVSNARVFASGQAGFRVSSGAARVSLSSCDSYTPGSVRLSNSGTFVEVVGGNIAGPVTHTISADAIALTRSDSFLRVYADAEGAASTDNLATISNPTDGQMLLLMASSNSRDIVVKHGTGNITLAGAADFTLDANTDAITLIYRAAATRWVEVGRSNNGA